MVESKKIHKGLKEKPTRVKPENFQSKRICVLNYFVKFRKGSRSEKCSSSLLGKQGESRGLLKYQSFPS